jgi:dsDNA-specific endonuclease/ATPase MutS2
MKFKVGDTVSILDEPFKGKILSVGARIQVLLEDGFEESYLPSQLSLYTKELFNLEPEIKDHTSAPLFKTQKISEIDLHFDALRMKIHKIEPQEVLQRQLILLQEEIRESISNKVDRLIVIHGIGKGILKQEVYKLIQNYAIITVRSLHESRYKNCAIALDFNYNI